MSLPFTIPPPKVDIPPMEIVRHSYPIVGLVNNPMNLGVNRNVIIDIYPGHLDVPENRKYYHARLTALLRHEPTNRHIARCQYYISRDEIYRLLVHAPHGSIPSKVSLVFDSLGEHEWILTDAVEYHWIESLSAQSNLAMIAMKNINLPPLAPRQPYARDDLQVVNINDRTKCLSVKHFDPICDDHMCTKQRMYKPKSDILRGCQSCERWYHYDCLVDDNKIPPLVQLNDPDDLRSRLRQWPIQRGHTQFEGPYSYELLVWKAQKMFDEGALSGDDWETVFVEAFARDTRIPEERLHGILEWMRYEQVPGRVYCLGCNSVV